MGCRIPRRCSSELQFRQRHLQQFNRRFVQRAVSLQLARSHPRVAGDARFAFETLLLTMARGDNALADLRGSFPGPFRGNFAELHRWHFDVNVNPVK